MATEAVLHFLSAGALQGLVQALQAGFEAEAGVKLQGRFGAVGAMREALEAGAPCDLMIVTDTMAGMLASAGFLRGDTRMPLGRVRTGIAVPAGKPLPGIATPDALRETLLAAEALYCPDTERATAGIHFARMLRELGILEALRPRLRTFPNGATAMRELAAAGGNALGCTQISEILFTPGVQAVGVLPKPFELATVYTAAVGMHAAAPALAARFIVLLSAARTRPLRQAQGIDD